MYNFIKQNNKAEPALQKEIYFFYNALNGRFFEGAHWYTAHFAKNIILKKTTI